MFAPMVNPYDSFMTKEEKIRIWEKWTQRRKFMYILARRFPKFLAYSYHRSFLSGKHGRIDMWLSLSLGKRVSARYLINTFFDFHNPPTQSPHPFIIEILSGEVFIIDYFK